MNVSLVLVNSYTDLPFIIFEFASAVAVVMVTLLDIVVVVVLVVVLVVVARFQLASHDLYDVLL